MNAAIPTTSPEIFRATYFREESNGNLSSSNIDLFTVHRVEGTCKFLNLPTSPHRSTTHECILLTEGSIVRSSGSDTVTVSKNNIFFLPSGQVTAIESISPDARGFYCHFDASVLVRKFINIHLISELSFLRSVVNPVIHVPAKSVSDLTLLFTRLLEESQCNRNEDLIQSYLLTILQEINLHLRPADSTMISYPHYLAGRFKDLVSVNYKNNLSIDHYAGKLGVSRNHLTRSVTSITGKTPSQWIDELVVLEARVLLCQSQRTVNEISYELGIDDPSYFSRMFKKRTGMKPSEFRRQFLKSRKEQSESTETLWKNRQ